MEPSLLTPYCQQQREIFFLHEEEVPDWRRGALEYADQLLSNLAPSTRVLDAGCGDGIILETARRFGFPVCMGIDLNPAKLARAARNGYPLLQADLHHLDFLAPDRWDLIVSSHSLEHTHDPSLVVDHFRRLLTPNGRLEIVLPFPDPAEHNRDAHCGKQLLGTDRAGNEVGVCHFFTSRGFLLTSCTGSGRREPEIWLSLRKAHVA